MVQLTRPPMTGLSLTTAQASRLEQLPAHVRVIGTDKRGGVLIELKDGCGPFYARITPSGRLADPDELVLYELRERRRRAR
jgi:hypothetical protein